MPRNGAIIFGDIVGKLDVLRIECTERDRAGAYSVRKLATRHGADTPLFVWPDEVTADCPRKRARKDYNACGAVCPVCRGLSDG